MFNLNSLSKHVIYQAVNFDPSPISWSDDLVFWAGLNSINVFAENNWAVLAQPN